MVLALMLGNAPSLDSLPADVFWGLFVTHSFLPYVLKTAPCLCGRLLSEVFQRKADYFIVTTSEKNIQLTAALLHRFCDFFKTFESSQVEDSGANK